MEQIKEIPKEMLTPRERSVLYGIGKEVDHIPYSLIGTEAAAELYGVDIDVYKRQVIYCKGVGVRLVPSEVIVSEDYASAYEYIDTEE